ncbi:MAG TPA: NAD(P)/FAD-dependent oxidoreductase [Flavisolibacter sp.]|jgi:monoamine oxidase|nr:NAD(P)/FAD-dependent oxidoreductase [Flavisolibacter sp.]
MEENSFDIIVIGAGAAGLMAAWELVQTGKRTAVIEAKNRVGGRTHTIKDNNFELPVELGAEFVHGNLELTKMLLKKAGAEQYKVSGDIWQNEDESLDEQSDFIEDFSALNKKFKELREDISVAEFINDFLKGDQFEEARFTLKNYVEGYYAADTHKASTFSLRDELTTSDDEQYRIEGGYIKLIDYLYGKCKEKGVQFFLSHPVKEIKWKKDDVEVVCEGETFHARKVLITVPVGVLQSETIHFSPAITNTINAAKTLGFGPVIKTLLQFDQPFWKNEKFTQGKDLDKLSFIFSKAIIPTWWTYYPKDVAMLTGWSGGPHAEELKDLSNEEILLKAIQSLSEIFSIDKTLLQQKLKGWHVANWVNDPYSCGGYSYEVVNGSNYKQIIKIPIENTIFFAGEGLIDGPEIGTVEAALSSGRETAFQMIAGFD